MPRFCSWPVSVAVDTALSLAFSSSVSVIGSDAGTATSSLTRCPEARPDVPRSGTTGTGEPGTLTQRRRHLSCGPEAASPQQVTATGGSGGMGSILGNRVLRVEDPRMLTVGGTYVEDVELAGALVLTYVTVARRPRGDRHDRLRRSARAAWRRRHLHRRRRGRRDRPRRSRQPTVPRRDAAAVRGRRARPLRRSARRRDRRRRAVPSGWTPSISSSSTTTRCRS